MPEMGRLRESEAIEKGFFTGGIALRPDGRGSVDIGLREVVGCSIFGRACDGQKSASVAVLFSGNRMFLCQLR